MPAKEQQLGWPNPTAYTSRNMYCTLGSFDDVKLKHWQCEDTREVQHMGWAKLPGLPYTDNAWLLLMFCTLPCRYASGEELHYTDAANNTDNLILSKFAVKLVLHTSVGFWNAAECREYH